MKIIRNQDLVFIPTSHDDPKDPGSLKKVLLKRADLIEGNIQMINWAKIPVGRSFEPHYHEDMEEVFIIITGTATIKVENEEDNLGAGDAIVIPIHATHQMTNTGSVDLEYIALGISPTGTGKTITV